MDVCHLGNQPCRMGRSRNPEMEAGVDLAPSFEFVHRVHLVRELEERQELGLAPALRCADDRSGLDCEAMVEKPSEIVVAQGSLATGHGQGIGDECPTTVTAGGE